MADASIMATVRVLIVALTFVIATGEEDPSPSPLCAKEGASDAALAAAMPSNCAEGDELLMDPSFRGIPGGWGIHRWQTGGAAASFNSPGVVFEVAAHADAKLYDVLALQEVSLDLGERYSLCVQGVTASSGGEATNWLRFAVDGGAVGGYQTAGHKPRSVLQLKTGEISVSCFSFELPNADDNSSYSGRISIELGNSTGQVALCHASLLQCDAPPTAAPTPQVTSEAVPPLSPPVPDTTQSPSLVPEATPAPAPARHEDLPPVTFAAPEAGRQAPICPGTPAELPEVHSCSGADLSAEMLTNPGFTGATSKGSWFGFTWQPGAADFYWGPEGVLVDVKEQNENHDLWAIALVQDIVVNVSTDSYELCIQAGAAEAGTLIRFAIDRGGHPDYDTPGGLERIEMTLSSSSLSTSCFRFALSPTLAQYNGRIAIELGKSMGQVGICQVSLRSCHRHSDLPAALPAIRRCHIAPLEIGAGCTQIEEHSGAEFEINSFGQETDGKRACLDKLRHSGGESFVYSPGKCQIWSCESRDDLLAAATGKPGEAHVYSNWCEYQEAASGRRGAEMRAPVFVKLWEWNFNDIARECEEVLGPNGYDAVQVMPVSEHVLGGSWHVKYMPVSMMLNSRSGTAEEFRCMVATCRAAGVEVIVDVVLNHIAEPCPAVAGRGTDAVTPCEGWGGSMFGNRRLPTEEGFEAVGPQHFHHLQYDSLRNCPVDVPSFTCPTSIPPGDCSKCDLFGLPDWNSELPEVQDYLSQHLQELHSLGVTMLRIDAASYIHPTELSKMLNRFPWDYVFQEWWAGIPALSRTRYVGAYRDIFFGRQVNRMLVLNEASDLPRLLNITFGLEGLDPQQGLWTITFHDQRSEFYDPGVPTYKGGLEFHQQQKFLLATPYGDVVRLWGGFGWTDLDDGPPGCSATNTDSKCDVTPVYDSDGGDRCMPSPLTTPIESSLSDDHRWACEHRWTGIAGLIDYRKSCKGLPVTQMFANDTDRGNFAFRAGDSCFVAIQKNMSSSLGSAAGAWSLEGLPIGLPEGHYCDLSSVPTRKGWDGTSCPNEVMVNSHGVVSLGTVPQGDLLAIHAGARLPISGGATPAMLRAKGERPSWMMSLGSSSVAQACAAPMSMDDDDHLSSGSLSVLAPILEMRILLCIIGAWLAVLSAWD